MWKIYSCFDLLDDPKQTVEDKTRVDCSLDNLFLSRRVREILKANEIYTTEQLIQRPLKEYRALPGCGYFSFSEIEGLYQTILDGGPLPTLPPASSRNLENEPLCADLPVSLSSVSAGYLFPSWRIQMALHRHGICTMGQVCALTRKQIREWDKIGDTAIEELTGKLRKWVLENSPRALQEEAVSPDEKDLFMRLEKLLSVVTYYDWLKLHTLAKEADLTCIPALIEEPDGILDLVCDLLNLPDLQRQERRFWSVVLKTPAADREELIRILRNDHVDSLADTLVDHAFAAGILIRRGTKILCERLSFDEYLSQAPQDERERSILKQRMMGKTFREIGENHGISQERASQIVKRRLGWWLPPFEEDWFAEPYKQIRFSSEEFRAVFPEVTEEGFRYLANRYKPGQMELNQENVKNWQGIWKEELLEAVQKKKVSIEGDRHTIAGQVRIIMDKNGNRPMKPEEILEEIRQSDLTEGSRKKQRSISMHGLKNELFGASNLILNQDGEVRNYQIDPERIFQLIDLTPYMDSVVSAWKIFWDHEELMKQLDLRDGYELYYVIQKSLRHCKGSIPVRYTHVPSLIIGDGDVRTQVLKLLKELAPVSKSDFFKAYSQRYGHREDSVRGSRVIRQTVSPFFDETGFCAGIPEMMSDD